MNLTELEEKCKNIQDLRMQLEQHRNNLETLQSQADERSRELQLMREIAKIRGDALPPESKQDEVERTTKMVESVEMNALKLEKEVYEGMKNITLPIPNKMPTIDSQGNSTIPLEGAPFVCAVKFMAGIISSDVPLQLDKTSLYPEKIVVACVKDAADVIGRLKSFHGNLERLAKITLGEQDPDVEQVVKYIHESEYKELWEAVKGRRKVTYEEIYADLKITEGKEKKRVRNFFTNLEQLLHEKFPFIRTDSGVYEMSFFGSLVWKRYNDAYSVRRASQDKSAQNSASEERVKEAPKETSMPSLNNYLSKDDKELVYGKEGE